MAVTEPDFQGLRDALDGNAVVSTPGDAGYDDAVRIWNAAITRRPSVVVGCTSDIDVSAALRFAQQEGLEVSVRGGGHNYAGLALTDGGLMIDLTPLKTVTVDPAARRATCGGGATWGELDAATQAHGLAVTGGFISTTGVAGLTLGGGIGWLVRKVGLSCDNVVGARVVTAEGRTLRATETDNPDLFWAIRGGGGNFGVVTEFEFALHPIGPMVHLGLFLFAPDQGPTCSASPVTTSAVCQTTVECSSPGSAPRRHLSCPRNCTSRRCSRWRSSDSTTSRATRRWSRRSSRRSSR